MKNKIFQFFIFCMIAIYTCIYLMINMGYYEYSNYKKRVLTEEQVKKFEKDIKSGYNIDVSSYIRYNDDFSKKPKRLIIKVSELISRGTKKCVIEMFKMLNKFIEN